MADTTGKQGFASMDEDKQKEIASKGGQSQGKENNPANFANRSEEELSEIGKKGAQAQPTEAKQKGGQHSHGGSSSDDDSDDNNGSRN